MAYAEIKIPIILFNIFPPIYTNTYYRELRPIILNNGFISVFLANSSSQTPESKIHNLTLLSKSNVPAVSTENELILE